MPHGRSAIWLQTTSSYPTELIISCRCFLAFKMNFSEANVFWPYIRRLLENTAVLSCHCRAKIIWIRHNSGTTMMSLWGKMVYEFRVLFIFFLVQEVQARHCWRQTKSFNTCKRCWRRKFVRSPCFTSFLAWRDKPGRQSKSSQRHAPPP